MKQRMTGLEMKDREYISEGDGDEDVDEKTKKEKKVKEADELGEEGDKDKAKKKNALVMSEQVEVTAKNVVQLELFLRPGSRRSGPSTRSLLRARRSRSPDRPFSYSLRI